MKAIETVNLEKSFKGVKALNGVSLSVNENEIYGLLGVNGAGKTTLIKILCNLLDKSGGKALVFGKDASSPQVKEIVDFSPQESSVAMNLSVKENLEFFADIYGQDKSKILPVIETFGLEDVLDKRAKTLSGGYQRRLSIAIALVSNPKILFLDEPTLGLDVFARRELWKIIKSLKGKMTIVITSHYLEEIETLCDRVSILSKGKLLCEGTIKEIKDKAGLDNFEDAFIKIVEEG